MDGAHDGPQHLLRRAEQFEKLANHVSRPNSRRHLLERAAASQAKAALMKAAHCLPVNELSIWLRRT